MGDANQQVTLGWLAPPLPIDLEGSVSDYARGSVDIAFRFGVDQANKHRACDDLRHNGVDLFRTIGTPIELPTCDHIAQMSLNVRPMKKDWEFFKSDHEAAYKQLPMRPEHANLATVSLRYPATTPWIAFHPNALLFGSKSEVLHYNFIDRLLSALFNSISVSL